MELSPLNGEPLPTIADARPPWAVDEVPVLPTVVQPVRPFSKSPFVMPLGGGAVTVRLTDVLWVAAEPVPVTVIVYVPVAVLLPTVSVSVEAPPAVTVVGLKAAVTPDGAVPASSAIVCADPLVTAVEIVDRPEEPRVGKARVWR